MFFYAFHEIYHDFKLDLQKMGQIVCPTAVVKLHIKKYNQFKKVFLATNRMVSHLIENIIEGRF